MMTIDELAASITSLPPHDKRKLLALLANEAADPVCADAPEIGWAKGLITVRADFDDPLPEFEDVTS